MFGYVNIDKNKLSDGEAGLYQTFMCGLCMSTKNAFSQKARMTVNFDINFFNVLFHSYLGLDVEVENKRCASHWFGKRTILKTDALTDKLAVANIILVYLDLYDDVVDGGSVKKKLAMKAFSKDYKKAAALWPQLADALNGRYAELRALEKENCSSLDRTAHSFAALSEDFCKLLLEDKANGFITTLCYNVGKWIYLIDALDDIKKDLSKGAYNAFTACYKGKDESFVKDNAEEIRFIMYSVLNRTAQSYNDLNLSKYACILNNVIYSSMRDKTERVLGKYLSDK